MRQERYLEQESSYLCAGVSEDAAVARRVFDIGRGAILTDIDGNNYIDFAAGMFTQPVGHSHPHVVEAMKAQVERLWNVHDFATPERLDLCELLVGLLPPQLDRFCFFSTGAEAVEAALRVVHGVAAPGRNRVGALRYGFHGKTMGARMLVHWDIGNNSFAGNSILGYSPYCYRCPFDLEYPSCDLLCARLVKRHICSKPNVAAFIFEPVQCAAGVIVPPDGYWEIINEACSGNGVLMVADEIATGGGRTGSFLASTLFGIEPDLVTLAKGLGSGFPFSMLLGRKQLLNAETLSVPGAYASAFGGNPLGIVAAKATLEVILREQVIQRVKIIGQRLHTGLRALADRYACVGDVRGLGLLFGIEFVLDKKGRTPAPTVARAVFERSFDLGLRSCLGGHVIRLAPPLNIEDDILEQSLEILDLALREVHREHGF
jgi:4-aminobutyrate aminotransferase/(S)-3-amino-2-methylpropionate transaminase